MALTRAIAILEADKADLVNVLARIQGELSTMGTKASNLKGKRDEIEARIASVDEALVVLSGV